jgi:CRP-like cAMP-binding protein
LSQRDLGNVVGASRERVNRWLQEWQRCGVLKVEKGTIAIMDEAGLRALVHPARRLTISRT